MKISIFKDDIIEGLQKAAGIIPLKSGAAYLRSIWLKAEADKMEILATDSSIEFRGLYTAEVFEPGLTGIQGRDLVDLLRNKNSSGKILFNADKESGKMLITHGRSEYRLPVNDPLWFQNLSDFPDNNLSSSVIWSGDFLQEIIDKVIYCISDDEAMDALSCMCIKPIVDGKIDICGLNGHQFSIISFIHDDLYSIIPSEGILIQKKYIKELKKWLDNNEIEVGISANRLFFRSQNNKEVFSLPISSYQYPDYMLFMSKINTDLVSTMTFKKSDILSALNCLLVFNTDSNRCTYFDFNTADKGEIKLSSTGQDGASGEEFLDIKYNGDIDKISFPTSALIEILSHFNSDEIRMVMSGSEGPCGIIGNDDPDYTVIIMPMKIVDNVYYKEEDI